MLFSSSVFLFLFLPVVLLVYYLPLRRWRQGQNVFLLLASLGFYAWGEPWFVLVMLGSILANYGFGLWVDACKRAGRTCAPPLVAALAVNLGILFVFKYLTFTLGILNRLGAAFVIPGIELPIGISFFTFQALSYVLDVHRDRGEVQRSPLKVGLYISFFPQLIAGPIVKYETVAQQIDHRKEIWADFSAGCSRFIVGLGKKVLLSNQLAVVADRAFGQGDGLSASFAWLGALCYTLQIYYDFSGYSDMAIGLGKQKGAESIHHQSPAIMHELVEEYGRTILENAPVLGGIAIIENAYDDTYLIKGLSPEEIISEEPKLKEISYKTIAHLLFDKCDVLVVDKIGKNISGDGMDPNVSGRFVQPKYCSGGIQAEKCVILDLTDETHGNAQGIGLAEVTTRRLFNKMKLEMTYPTGVTNTFLHLMKIPMIMDNDREALQLALMCCPEAEDHDHMKMIRIPNTAHIGVIEISEGMLPLVENNPNFEVLTEPYDLPFDENGNLF